MAAWAWETRAAWTDWAAPEEDGEPPGEGFCPPMPTGDVGMPEGVPEEVSWVGLEEF